MSDQLTPRLVIDPKREFVRRKTAALELQREEFRVARRISKLQRQVTDMQARAQRAQDDAERAEAEAAALTEAEAAARKREEAEKAQALAAQLWDTTDTLLGEMEELSATGMGMLGQKATLIARFVDAIAYDGADGTEVRRWTRPSIEQRGADDKAFQAEVDELVQEADEEQFNALLERFTGGKAASPPEKSDKSTSG